MSNWKVVDADDLDGKLSAIGDAIRGKTNKTDMIPVQNMASEISMISTVGGRLSVTVAPKTICRLHKDSKSYTKTSDDSGVVVFDGLEQGTWTLTCENGTSHGEFTKYIGTDYFMTPILNGPVLFDYYAGPGKYVNVTGAIDHRHGDKEYTYDGRSGYTSRDWTYIREREPVKGDTYVGTQKYINFYNFRKLRASGSIGYSTDANKVFMIISSDIGDIGSGSGIVLARNTCTVGDEYSADFSVDISALNGGYISFANTGRYGTAEEASWHRVTIDKIWLEL